MESKPSYDINGSLWVLFRSRDQQPEYRVQVIDDKRAILLFSSHDKADYFAAKYALNYKAITLESIKLWNDFFQRRASEGVSIVVFDMINPTSSVWPYGIDTFMETIVDAEHSTSPAASPNPSPAPPPADA